MSWLGDAYDWGKDKVSDGWNWLSGGGPAGWIRAILFLLLGIALVVFAVAIIWGFIILAEAALFFIVLSVAFLILYELVSYIVTRNDDKDDDKDK